MRIELNVTLACNASCPNCNRLCHLYKEREDHVTPEQVIKMISQIRESGQVIDRVKVAGGEPLVNPHFSEIHWLLGKAIDEGLIKKVKIDSNGIKMYPTTLAPHPKIHRGGRRAAIKLHLPTFVSPYDMGHDPDFKCSVPSKCGFSLDAHGWLPCSAAIAIVRAFHLDHIYKREMPTKTWCLSELCRFCVLAMPKEWKRKHAKSLHEQYVLITPAWRFALNDSDGTTTAPLY